MKSIRLNKDIRTEIVSNIMASYSEENVRPTEPKDSMEDLHEAVTDWLLAKYADTLALYEKVDKKHDNLIKTVNKFEYVSHNKDYFSIHFSTKSTSGYIDSVWQDAEYFPNIWNGCVIDLSNKDTAIPSEIQEIIDNIDGNKKSVRKQKKLVSDYDNEYGKYRQDVTQVIDGCNTSGQLIEVWEEVERFLPKGVMNPSKINLPAINIASLNRKLSTKEVSKP